MMDPFEPKKKSLQEFVFCHLAEVLLFSGLILLLITVTAPMYERSRLRSQLALSYQNLNELVEALLVYSYEQPESEIFPPRLDALLPGINLCPIVDPVPRNMVFLTTPAAYLDEIPYDPFLSRIVEHTESLTPFVTHWVKAGSASSLMAPEYSNIAWGAFSIGPAVKLPPQYSITVLRRTPYENASLRKNLYDPSNGLTSIGLIYYDSLGNKTSIDDM
ncbi:MAG: hypothetical protein JXR73_07780 [Candidatus Omnitrophica bacterium]|nr:hypothetical protein [Candidatus Omnitrophota bacterium]